MSETPVYILLFVALILPAVGALLLRLLMQRLSDRIFNIGVALVFGTAMAAVLILSRAEIPLLRIGDVTLLLPGTRFNTNDSADVTAEPMPTDGMPALPTAALGTTVPATIAASAMPTAFAPPTLTPRPSVTVTPAPTATAAPTATLAPTATVEPTATVAAPAAAQTYTVQEGDYLRAIADRFGVTISALLTANNLTPAEADSLRVGQELVIP